VSWLFGLATFGGRILIGFLVDRFDARRIALIFFLLSALGIPLLSADLPIWAVFVAAFLLGGSLGAEVDMLAYLTSRYFGLRCFARIFGVLFGAVMLAMGAGPVIFGAIFDATGSYNLMLYAGAPLCAAAALVTLALRPYAQRRRGGPVSVT
jgi:predicted MFS family arabinose efflux permease